MTYDSDDGYVVEPPFRCLDMEGLSTVIDSNGMCITLDFRNRGFMEELAKVMNENSERLVSKWRSYSGRGTKTESSSRKRKRRSSAK